MNLDLTGTEIQAVLGPTNTGKTHAAITRMLQHPSGMMGFPLRLLAREVYDRISALRGERAVALITGEEKRIGAEARYFLCTTEAMPLDRSVSFLAVDEVQLAGDRNRGHVFTDRLLRARGARETWFLGSDTIAPLLETLLPTTRLEARPRRSKLTHTGHRKLGRLPPRTAVVAFSAEHVYALAEQMRAHHGGTAVVLGALSPRTRNAQVAMYEAGEVQYLVATDAIGMGLNMNIDHVAFDSIRKFDGQGFRHLTAAEIAQIAGRAGRNMRDGTFGSTGGLDDIDARFVEAVESHTFPPLKVLWYRNTELDFSSIEALLATLLARPPRPCLKQVRDEEDEITLKALIRDPEVRAHAASPERVRLLWEVCQIPDFRKTLTDAHARLVREVFLQLVHSDGVLDAAYVGRHMKSLDRTEGDIDALMTRLSWIRTWTFITHRADWLVDAGGWQERARAIEDRLSDALHELLTLRFVDRRMAVLGSAAIEAGQLRAGTERLGRLTGIYFRVEPGVEQDRRAQRRIRELLADALPARIQALVDAPHDAFTIDAQGLVSWEDGPVARLVGGTSLTTPQIKLVRNEWLEPGAVLRVERRMQAWARDLVEGLLGSLNPAEAGALRGLVYALRESLGLLHAAPVEELLAGLGPQHRQLIARRGIRLGVHFVYVLPLLSASARQVRARLWSVYHKVPTPAVPTTPTALISAPPSFYEAIGYVIAGGHAVSVEVWESTAAALRRMGRGGPFVLHGPLAETLGEAAPDVLKALGFRRQGERWAAR